MIGGRSGPGLASVWANRNPAPGRLQPEQAIVGGRNTNGATAIVGTRHGHNASRDRSTRTAAGATRRALGIPVVTAGAPQRRFGHGLEAEFRGCRATKKNQLSLPGTAHKLGIPRSDVLQQSPAAVCTGMPGL